MDLSTCLTGKAAEQRKELVSLAEGSEADSVVAVILPVSTQWPCPALEDCVPRESFSKAFLENLLLHCSLVLGFHVFENESQHPPPCSGSFPLFQNYTAPVWISASLV